MRCFPLQMPGSRPLPFPAFKFHLSGAAVGPKSQHAMASDIEIDEMSAAFHEFTRHSSRADHLEADENPLLVALRDPGHKCIWAGPPREHRAEPLDAHDARCVSIRHMFGPSNLVKASAERDRVEAPDVRGHQRPKLPTESFFAFAD